MLHAPDGGFADAQRGAQLLAGKIAHGALLVGSFLSILNP